MSKATIVNAIVEFNIYDSNGHLVYSRRVGPVTLPANQPVIITAPAFVYSCRDNYDLVVRVQDIMGQTLAECRSRLNKPGIVIVATTGTPTPSAGAATATPAGSAPNSTPPAAAPTLAPIPTSAAPTPVVVVIPHTGGGDGQRPSSGRRGSGSGFNLPLLGLEALGVLALLLSAGRDLRRGAVSGVATWYSARTRHGGR